jgi:hypothetical protein
MNGLFPIIRRKRRPLVVADVPPVAAAPVQPVAEKPLVESGPDEPKTKSEKSNVGTTQN